MNDKEMLELAAKAAGIDWFDDPAAKHGCGLHMKSGPFWNPLTDDGDALRLAVKLHINIEIWNLGHVIRASIYVKDRGHGCFQEYYIPEPYAATRRAIVRAAAEIGKEKK